MEYRTAKIVGVDLGDKVSHVCELDLGTGCLEHWRVSMSPASVRRAFAKVEARRIVMEVGGQSRWFSKLLEELGFEVIVADARRIALITKSLSKNDRNDAELLARLGASDLELLRPIHHRGDRAQCDLSVIKARDTLVRTRTRLVVTIRGTLKQMGIRLGGWTPRGFVKRAREQMPQDLRAALVPLLEVIDDLTTKIHEYEKQIEEVCKDRYPETAALTQVQGVGSLTALAFVLILEDPNRFAKSRTVGSYLGLRPRQSDSGESVKQLGITKAGDGLLRRLMVHSAHYVLGPFGGDSDLRRWGLELAARGGKNAKKRAAVAVARKLSVLLHRLWKTQATYEPLRKASLSAAVA